jgi:hypothetical protein
VFGSPIWVVTVGDSLGLLRYVELVTKNTVAGAHGLQQITHTTDPFWSGMRAPKYGAP